MHVDEFIESKFGEDTYARWVLMHFRLPATLKIDFREFMKSYHLFCTYEGKRMRCTGASRFGDIWLTSDFEQDVGYEKRVDITDCNNWGSKV